MVNPHLDNVFPKLLALASSGGDDETSLRGHVETSDEMAGIEGWALDQLDLAAPLPIDLCLDERIIATTMTNIVRDDLSLLLGVDVTPGFRFGPAVMRLVAAQAKTYPNSLLQVRIGGRALQLGAEQPLPKAGRVARLIAEADSQNTQDQRFSLHTLLLRLTTRAEGLLAHPLRLIPENAQGVIEVITVNPAGYVWFSGWMNKGHLLEFSAVIADRGKLPCGVALLCHDRADLQSHSCGVVGVIVSDWQPNTLNEDFALFFGRDARLYFRTHKPLRIASAAEFVSDFERVRATCHNDRRAPAIMRLLHDLEHWSLTSPMAQGFVAYASVDRLLLIPGFGYMAEGWVISPAKRIDHLQLRVEGKTWRCAMETLFHKPRPDLLGAYPGQNVLVQKAGFVTCFMGDITSEDVSEPMLKIVFEDGSTWNQPIAPEIVCQLGHSAALDALRLFYPAVEDEPFFPALAGKLLRPRPSPPLRAQIVAPAPAVAIFMLPPDRCDLILLFDDVAQYLGMAGDPFSFAFVASTSAARADAVRLFGDLAREFPGKASLFFAEDDSQPMALIVPVLEATGARRFLFAAPAVFLSAVGWAALPQALGRAGGLEFFEVAAAPWQSQDNAATPDALCFAWSADAVTAWRDTAPRVLGGFYRDNGLALWESNVVWRKNAARMTRPHYTSALEAVVNARALEAADAP